MSSNQETCPEMINMDWWKLLKNKMRNESSILDVASLRIKLGRMGGLDTATDT